MLPTVKGDNQNHLSMCFQTIFWPVGKKKMHFRQKYILCGTNILKIKTLGMLSPKGIRIADAFQDSFQAGSRHLLDGSSRYESEVILFAGLPKKIQKYSTNGSLLLCETSAF